MSVAAFLRHWPAYTKRRGEEGSMGIRSLDEKTSPRDLSSAELVAPSFGLLAKQNIIGQQIVLEFARLKYCCAVHLHYKMMIVTLFLSYRAGTL